MSCFFGCFRVKASHSHLTGPRKEIVVSCSRNALSSLFLHDDDSTKQNEQSWNQNRDQPDVKKHKNEDNVLKASGTLTEAPIELEKALEMSEDKSIQCGETKSISSLRVEKLNLETLHEDSPTHVKVCGGDSLGGSCSLAVDSPSPSSCITDGNSIRRSSIKSPRDEISHKDVQDAETRSETSSVSPDHIYAPNAYSALDPTEMPSEWRKAEEKDTKYGKQMRSEDWASKDSGKVTGEYVRHRRIPSDRPILGMVAAHWKDEEVSHSHVPPKWWDGNGIPNSTNKYQEDQKVNWHAASFEERLEKALSEEILISQMKHTNTASNVELDESEESDTAWSRLDSSARLKSIFSL